MVKKSKKKKENIYLSQWVKLFLLKFSQETFDIIQSTLSAIKAFGEKMGVTANNIANVEIEGIRSQSHSYKDPGRIDEVCNRYHQMKR